jgi:2-C-methyl-D-erythritol 4-phosphate cytidylyltransferase
MSEAGVEVLDIRTDWEDIAAREEPLVLHDPLCPMTPPDFIAACVAEAFERDVVIVGVRPVTDTVKQVVEGDLGATVDRDRLVGVAAPIVVPAAVVAALADAGGLPSSDFVALTRWLREHHEVTLREAPATARRVASTADLELLAALADG